jgi:hypothetical protein
MFGQQGKNSAVDRPQLRLVVHAEAYQGLGDVRGQLLFDGVDLRFDFQAADALFGLIKSGSRQVQVPLTAIESVRSGLGWFWLMPYIEIELNDMALLNQVPGTHEGGWRLRVRFADRRALKRFADAVSFARSGHLHQRMSDSLPSAPPPISMPEAPDGMEVGDPEARRRREHE